MSIENRLRRSAVAHLSRVLLEDLESLEAENERLREERDAYADPANWAVDWPLGIEGGPGLTYTGPNPSDSAEADEGEGVRGEVAGFEADHPNSVGWLHIATQEERIPFATGTPVRITRLPESEEGSDE